MPAAKRKAAGKHKQSKSTTKQSKQDGQKAVSHDIDVPLDEGFNGQFCFNRRSRPFARCWFFVLFLFKSVFPPALLPSDD